MGDNADIILDGVVDQYTGEYIGGSVGYPRSGSNHRMEPRDTEKYSKSTRAIRKELAILIKEKQKSLISEKELNKAVNDARQEINQKYGKGWREQI